MGSPRHRLWGTAVLLGASIVIAGACTNRGAESSTTTRSTAPTRSPSSGAVRFGTGGGDAFAWAERVTGRSECGPVSLRDNGRPVGSRVEMRHTTFRATVPLVPGRNELVALCRSGERSSPIRFDGRLRPGPEARIRVRIHDDVVALDGTRSLPGVPERAKVVKYSWSPDPRHPSRLMLRSGRALTGHVSRPRLELRAPRSGGEKYVRLTVVDALGRKDTSTTYFVVHGGRPRAADLVHSHPSWIDSAVIYAPIPQLWGNGGPRSVEHRLPYLRRLGVDALWLWPPAERRVLGEAYRIADYFELDPSWGPPSAFKHMVDAAHRLGMHVMIDFVPNHTSVEHRYFVDQKRKGTRSHYYSFYDRNEHGRITQYRQIFHANDLPNLNYDNPEVRRMIIEASLHWIRRYGIDGFRVDAAWGVERRRPTFWAHWRRALKRVDPDLLLLAESSAINPHIFRGFDVAYDWSNQPGQWAWTSVFKFPQDSGALLRPAITNDPKGYAPNAIVMRFLDNNDTEIRFADEFGPDLTRVAATLQFTVPGIPEMFAGDEIGASFQPYSNLTPIPWRDTHGLRPFYERLIDLKHSVPALNTHHVDVLSSTPDSSFVYVRPAPPGGGRPVLVLLNFGAKAKVAVTRTPLLDEVIGTSGATHDLLTGKGVKFQIGRRNVSLRTGSESEFVLVPGAR